jgi:nucleotide-binding universal stress UspA family protein
MRIYVGSSNAGGFMKQTFPMVHKKILVATSFDEHLEALLQSAEHLSHLTGASVRLLHVCDPWAKSFLSSVADAGATDLVDALKKEAMRIAANRLDSISRSFSKDVKVETKVVSGDVAKLIADDAKESGCGMILVGASKAGVSGTIQGFSSAISLVMESSVPIMVVNKEAMFDPKQKGPTLLACDDFTEVAGAALEVGFSLASSIKGSTLVHLHVESYGELPSHVKLRDSKTNSSITPEQLEHLNRVVESKMIERASDWPARLESKGSRYEMQIVTGNVPDEIERSAVASRADIVLFGQHKVFHRKSMHVGKVPYKVMLDQNRPVIVVPIEV